MNLFRNKYRVESTRLVGWDYSRGGDYFITICTKNRRHYFGEIVGGKMQETEQYKIGMDCWNDLPNHYPNCVLDAFVIMPNHVHMIISIRNDHMVDRDDPIPVETGFKPVSTNAAVDTNAATARTTTTATITKPQRYSVSEIVRGFKTFTARKINEYQNTQGKPFWQSRFHDHIIRDWQELNRIRRYIINNPGNWEKDRNNQEGLYI